MKESFKREKRLSSFLNKIKQNVQNTQQNLLESPTLIPNVECARRVTRQSATLLALTRNGRKNSTIGDMTMWLGQFIKTCQENVGLSEMKSDITMIQNVCLKIVVKNSCGTSVCKQIRLRYRIWLSLTRKRKAVF